MKRFCCLWAALMLLGAATFGVAAEPVIQPVEYLEELFDSNNAVANAFGGSDQQQPPTGQLFEGTERPAFMSDHSFDNFIGPVTNPVLSKDARSLTEARFLFVQNKIDPQHPFGSGDFQAYGLQLRLALTDRLTLIADKDGYAAINPATSPQRTGWLDLAAGLKYAFIRDVENQFLLTGGFLYEIPSGSQAVFQDHGDGIFTFFASTGKEFSGMTHWLNTVGYQVPVDGDANSSFVYWSTHLDRQLWGWFYPLIEANWYHYVSSGNRGLPSALGEGDGLINLGTSGVTGNDLVTVAVGAKAKLTQNVEFGGAWELPVSPRHDLLNNRLTAELIFRY
jgi:hypothetical protein